MGERDGINFQGPEETFWCDGYNYLDGGSNCMTIYVCQNSETVTVGDYTSIKLTKNEVKINKMKLPFAAKLLN